MIEIIKIGKYIEKNEADFEFVGMAYFTEKGSEILKKVYDECKKIYSKEKFHDAKSFEKAGVTDIIQEIIDRGFTVNALQVYKGWIEIHNKNDKEIAGEMIKNL
jgi:phosphoenolpyruvate phosphomutase